MAGMLLVETVLFFRPSNTLPGRGLEAKKMLTGFSGILVAFWLLARNPDNRFQYPHVSLGFDTSRLIWFSPGVPETLLEKYFATPRSGS